MSKTLFDLTYQLARLLGTTSEGVATGGSVSTILDSVERTEADDYWNGGPAWILYDAGGAGAAPQGETGYISDFTSTGGVVTLRTALTVAVAAGDRYAIGTLRYPMQLLVQKINEAIGGVIEIVDKTTIVIAAGQTEYSLPSGVVELKQVHFSSNGDTDDNDWQKMYDWRVEKSATGTADKLILMRQLSTSDIVKLTYLGYHSRLQNATDKLDDSFHVNRVIYNAAVGCLLWYKAKVGDSDMSVNDLLNYYQPMANQMNTDFVQQLPKRTAKLIHPRFK